MIWALASLKKILIMHTSHILPFYKPNMFARSALIRCAAKTVRNVRQMSGNGSTAEHLAEVAQWKKFTAGMVVISVTCALYNIAVHSHHHGRTDMPYMKIRNKPFHWECQDCDLFDRDCWAGCRGEAKEAH